MLGGRQPRVHHAACHPDTSYAAFRGIVAHCTASEEAAATLQASRRGDAALEEGGVKTRRTGRTMDYLNRRTLPIGVPKF
jgi:hypothetical protein